MKRRTFIQALGALLTAGRAAQAVVSPEPVIPKKPITRFDGHTGVGGFGMPSTKPEGGVRKICLTRQPKDIVHCQNALSFKISSEIPFSPETDILRQIQKDWSDQAMEAMMDDVLSPQKSK